MAIALVNNVTFHVKKIIKIGYFYFMLKKVVAVQQIITAVLYMNGSSELVPFLCGSSE